MNRSRLAPLVSVVAFVTTTSFAHAQFPPTGFSPDRAIQGFQDSLQEAIRSASEDQNRPSMAMIDRERARSMNYDNQIKEVRTIFEKRKLKKQYREAERKTPEERQRALAAAAGQAPDRLSTAQYDAFTGRIRWPAVIRADNYSVQRESLDDLFAAHCEDGGGVDTLQYAEIQDALDGLNTDVKKRIRSMNPDQYTYARRFLDSLKYEARIPVGR